MHTIFKFELGILEKQSIMLPPGYRIIRVATIEGRLYVWAIVNTDELPVPVQFEMYKTGQEISKPDDLTYHGFCAIFVGMELGLYVFTRG